MNCDLNCWCYIGGVMGDKERTHLIRIGDQSKISNIVVKIF